MTNYTNTQVQEQKERFEAFIKTANLAKIGKTYIGFQLKDAGNGLYNQYNYIRRVLRLCANVCHSMHHPEHKSNLYSFYGDILQIEAMNAFLDSIKKEPVL